MERFTTEELNTAMQAGWHRPYDSVTFYAIAIDDSGAVFKMNEAFYPLMYTDRGLDSSGIGEREIPTWADHSASIRLSAEFPGGSHPQC